MLPESDKEKIRLEEQYRLEVRKQLEDKPKRTSRIWTFLNSTFGLWLLSALLITWAGTLYTQSQNRHTETLKKQEVERAEAQKEAELIERLDLEIGYRFSRFQTELAYLVQPDWSHIRFLPGKGQKDVREIVDSLSQPPKGKRPSLYEEFSNTSTLALIAELRRHVPLGEREELDQVIADLSGIYIYFEVRKVKLDDVLAVAKAVDSGLYLARWRKGRFYFADAPFI